MKTDVRSLVEMASGAILERVDYETMRVMNNIMDPNTNPIAKRKITLTLEFKPDKNRQMISVEATAKSTLAPTDPIALSLYTGMEQGQFVAVEMSNGVPGQTDMYGGDVPDRVALRFPNAQIG